MEPFDPAAQGLAPRLATGVSPGVSPKDVHGQLGRILQSRGFARSERMSRFLRFTVERVLAGAGDELKEYVVGVEVFDRKRDYDPRVDPIVRVEARRLRAKLKSYYGEEGREDRLRIEFPKGSYAPVIHTGTAAGAAPVPLRREAPAALAVLPFTNLSRDTGDEYFSDGLTEELIHLLTRIEGLRVVAWHSASLLRGRERDLTVIREQLKAATVLRGSVRCQNTRVRVTAQLLDTGDGSVLWSEVYDRDLGAVFAIQEEIARAIVTTLRAAWGNAEPVVTRATTLECYNLCLKGRYAANRRSADGIRQSEGYYRQAIQADEGSAMAQAGLADALSLACDYGLAASREVMPQAEAAVLRALELEPESGDALASLAFIRSQYDWRWAEAEVLYRRAIEKAPGNAKARHWFAIDHLALLGRFDEALRQIEIARSLDPLSLILHESYAYLHILKRDYGAALQACEQIHDLDPGFLKAHGTRGRALSLMGRYEDALNAFNTARRGHDGVPSLVAAMGQTYALAGNRTAAMDCLGELKRMAADRHVPANCYAVVYLGLGEHARVLDCLERAEEQKSFPLCGVYMHPLYDAVRGEPRFQALVQRMGFDTP